MSDQSQGDDPLERLYREGPAEQPPAALDQRIQAAAAAAADRQSPGARSLWLAGGAGFASAAVLLLSVTLLLRIGDPPVPETIPGVDFALEDAPVLSPQQLAAPGSATENNEDLTAIRREAAELAVQARQLASAAADQSRGFAAASRQAPTPDATQLVTEACPTPWELPAGARISPLPDGLRVTANGQTFALRCAGGSWVREPVSADPQSNR